MLEKGKLLDNYTMRKAFDLLNRELNSDNKYVIRFDGELFPVPEITHFKGGSGSGVYYDCSYEGHKEKINEKLEGTNIQCYKIGERKGHTYAIYQNVKPATIKQFISEVTELDLLNDIIELVVETTKIVRAIEK